MIICGTGLRACKILWVQVYLKLWKPSRASLWHTHIALRIAGGVSLSWQRIAQQIPPGRSYSTHCLLMPSWVFFLPAAMILDMLTYVDICWHMLTYVDMFEPVTCSRLVLAHRRKTFQFCTLFNLSHTARKVSARSCFLAACWDRSCFSTPCSEKCRWPWWTRRTSLARCRC